MGANLSKALGEHTRLSVKHHTPSHQPLARLFGNKEMRLLMLGLDAAGKTSTPPPSLTHTSTDPRSSSHSIQTQVEPVCDHDTNRSVLLVRTSVHPVYTAQSASTWRRSHTRTSNSMCGTLEVKTRSVHYGDTITLVPRVSFSSSTVRTGRESTKQNKNCIAYSVTGR